MKKILLILMIFLLSGCWNYRELNDLAITTGIAIDKSDEGYEVTVNIANSQKNSGDSKNVQAASTVYSGKGETIYEALKDTALSVSKQIYIGHLEILLLSESVAEEGTLKILDFLFRYPQARNDFYVAIAKGCDAKDLLMVTTPLDTISTQNIAKNLQVTNRLQGFTYTVKFNEFIDNIITPGTNPVLPTVELIGDVEEGNKDDNIERTEPETYLKLGMMAIFNNDKFIGFTNEDQSKGLNIINNKIEITGIVIDYNNAKVVSEISSLKSSIEYKNDKFKVKTNITASIEEIPNDIDLRDEKNIEEIKNKSIEEIKRLINESIKFSKENKSDIFGFGNILYKTDLKKWNEVKNDWDDLVYPNIEIEIDVKLDLETKGTINTYIKENGNG